MKYWRKKINTVECPYCKGSGVSQEGTECPWCYGSGLYNEVTESLVEEEDNIGNH
jgi:DnaJ-class molecular chaperone